uniref:RRM domain-containing protein n=1 Tax=Dicentrarchus labrax TaxID=13489 RepID=A0A8C4GM44_DICLA
MSHNYPYRRRLSDSSDLRPDPVPYSSSDRHHASPDFYRPPQESFSASSSSASSRGTQWNQDGALSILSSCGLEPSDLALLAELPEDVLTIESLPQVLNQIKGKRGTIKPFLSSTHSSSSSSPYPHSSAHRPASNPSFSSSSWDHPHNQPIQYPLDQVTPSPLSADTDRWGNPRTSTCVRADPPSSSSSSYGVDFHHRSRPSEYGKTGRDTGLVSSQDFNHRPGPSEYGKTCGDTGLVSSQDFNHRPGPSEYGKTGRDPGPVSSQDRSKRTRPSRFSQPGPADYRSAPLPDANHTRTCGGHRESETFSVRSRPAALMPSNKEALDFHGTSPPVFPYSCSLCDITVMSEKVWIKHINGTQHADGQLSLLQQFPNWDCRMETISRADSQPERGKDEGNSGRQPQTANHNSKQPPNIQPHKKASEKAKSKVVCVKFPAQSVDEAYLRKLTEPFGKIVKILMFPSLAFVELGSIDQAKDLVKFHVNYPPTVNGEQIEFRLSNTFSFLQSSRVVSFTPAPSGENGQSDLISIVKRFGEPLYTLFLPSKEEPGFPVDLENCITLDELEEEQSEDPDEVGDGDGPGESTRVVYFRNLPLRSYSNADFLRLVRDFGTAVRYFHKPPSCGFIEMSSSSEALRAVKELCRTPVTFHGSRLVAQISNKYRRLTDGWEVQPDQNSDERRSRSSSRRSERPDRDESSRKSEGGKESSKQAPEKTQKESNKKSSERESRDSPKRKSSEKKTPEDKESLKSDPKNMEPDCRNESQTSKKSCSENESYDNKSLENDPKNVSETISRKSPEKESVSKDESENISRVTPENESYDKKSREKNPKHMSDKDLAARNSSEKTCRTTAESANNKSPERESESRKSPERESESEKSPERESESRKSPERGPSEKSPEKSPSPERESESEKSPERESESEKSPERESESRKSPERESESRKSPERESESEKSPEKESETRTSPEKMLRKRRETGEKDSVPEKKKKKKESARDETEIKTELEATEAPEEEKMEISEETCGPGLKDSESSDQPDFTGDPPKPQTAQKPADELQDSEDHMEEQSGPAGGAAEPQRPTKPTKPTKPVGTEFVRPVVGYFCNLCQLIYADEDEAKLQHCSSPAHYRKYQEKTGKDPWASCR